MHDYDELNNRQTFDARLDTLINIVRGVAENRRVTPAFATLGDHAEHCGMVGAKWVANEDRDNRGKIYLYFSPEDVTVALDHLQGIGWQGVPDYMDDGRFFSIMRHPMADLCQKVGTPPASGFYQRVFTNKLRFDPATKKVGPVKVGQAPHDFALRIRGEHDFELRKEPENEYAHVAASNRGHRGRSPAVIWPVKDTGASFYEAKARHAILLREGIRTINGEALRMPAFSKTKCNTFCCKVPPW